MIERWYKAPVACLFDVRIARLPAGLFRTWAQLSALSSLNGGALPDVQQIAFSLHSSPATIVKRLTALADRGLASLVNDAWTLTDLSARADEEGPAPLSGAERTRRWRERQAAEAAPEAASPRDEELAPRDALENRTKEKNNAVTTPPVTARPKAAAPPRPPGVYIPARISPNGAPGLPGGARRTAKALRPIDGADGFSRRSLRPQLPPPPWRHEPTGKVKKEGDAWDLSITAGTRFACWPLRRRRSPRQPQERLRDERLSEVSSCIGELCSRIACFGVEANEKFVGQGDADDHFLFT
ncbi:MAG: hypothetical protein ACLQMV_10000, partial [Rhodoblastus sp.]